jgi:hypothetical protein
VPVIVKGKVPAGAAALAVSDKVDFPLEPGVNWDVTPGGKPDVLNVTFGGAPEGDDTVTTIDEVPPSARLIDVEGTKIEKSPPGCGLKTISRIG